MPTTDHDEVLQQLASWQDGGHKVAVATVVRTWGSSPRPVGSQLGINDRGDMVGSVSGGCIEGAVVREALEIMEGASSPRLLEALGLRRVERAGLGSGPRLWRQARGLYRGHCTISHHVADLLSGFSINIVFAGKSAQIDP